MSGHLWVDGRVLAEDRISLPPSAPALAHGHGLFTTIACRSGHPMFLDRHLRRLAGSARALRIPWTHTEAAVRGGIRELLARAGLQDAAARLQLLLLDDDASLAVLSVSPPPAAPDPPVPVRIGLAAPRFRGPRTLAEHKTLNYLQSRLALAEGMARGLAEVLFALPEGTILEGTRSSVFLVRDGRVVTPPLHLPILPGVTRELIVEVASGLGVPVEERTFGLSELEKADEIFITGSVRGVRPVAAVENRNVPAAPGNITISMQKGYGELSRLELQRAKTGPSDA